MTTSETPLQTARRLELPVRPCIKAVGTHKAHTYNRTTTENGRRKIYVAWCPGRTL